MKRRTLSLMLMGGLIFLLPLSNGCSKTQTRTGKTSSWPSASQVSKEEKARAKAEEKALKAEEKRLKKEEKERLKEEAKRSKEEEKRLKKEEKERKKAQKDLKKEEAKRQKEEKKRRKEEEKRRSKALVKNPETPEGRAAEMIVKFYEFYFPIMLVFEENEDCLRKAGVSKADLCSGLRDVGAAKITAIDTMLGKPESYGGKERTTIAAKIQGTIIVKGKKRKVAREEIFYLDSSREGTEFADAHGMFRLTFRKEGAGGK